MFNPNQGVKRKKKDIDCYEFYLWSTGKKIPRGWDDTEFWEFVKRMDGGDGFYGLDNE
jgi:hypothetical protein